MCPNCGCGWKFLKNAKNWDGFIQNWKSTFFASPMLGCCLRKTATFVVESWSHANPIDLGVQYPKYVVSVCVVYALASSQKNQQSAQEQHTITYQLKEAIWATTSLHSDDSVLSSTTKLNHGICKKNTPKVASCGAPQKIPLICP